jgi:hypothetical protein
MYNDRNKFKLHFCALRDTYGIKRKPTGVKNQQSNAILECIHAVFTNMSSTAENDTGDSHQKYKTR